MKNKLQTETELNYYYKSFEKFKDVLKAISKNTYSGFDSLNYFDRAELLEASIILLKHPNLEIITIDQLNYLLDFFDKFLFDYFDVNTDPLQTKYLNLLKKIFSLIQNNLDKKADIFKYRIGIYLAFLERNDKYFEEYYEFLKQSFKSETKEIKLLYLKLYVFWFEYIELSSYGSQHDELLDLVLKCLQELKGNEKDPEFIKLYLHLLVLVFNYINDRKTFNLYRRDNFFKIAKTYLELITNKEVIFYPTDYDTLLDTFIDLDYKSFKFPFMNHELEDLKPYIKLLQKLYKTFGIEKYIGRNKVSHLISRLFEAFAYTISDYPDKWIQIESIIKNLIGYFEEQFDQNNYFFENYEEYSILGDFYKLLGNIEYNLGDLKDAYINYNKAYDIFDYLYIDYNSSIYEKDLEEICPKIYEISDSIDTLGEANSYSFLKVDEIVWNLNFFEREKKFDPNFVKIILLSYFKRIPTKNLINELMHLASLSIPDYNPFKKQFKELEEFKKSIELGQEVNRNQLLEIADFIIKNQFLYITSYITNRLIKKLFPRTLRLVAQTYLYKSNIRNKKNTQYHSKKALNIYNLLDKGKRRVKSLVELDRYKIYEFYIGLVKLFIEERNFELALNYCEEALNILYTFKNFKFNYNEYLHLLSKINRLKSLALYLSREYSKARKLLIKCFYIDKKVLDENSNRENLLSLAKDYIYHISFTNLRAHLFDEQIPYYASVYKLINNLKELDLDLEFLLIKSQLDYKLAEIYKKAYKDNKAETYYNEFINTFNHIKKNFTEIELSNFKTNIRIDDYPLNLDSYFNFQNTENLLYRVYHSLALFYEKKDYSKSIYYLKLAAENLEYLKKKYHDRTVILLWSIFEKLLAKAEKDQDLELYNWVSEKVLSIFTESVNNNEWIYENDLKLILEIVLVRLKKDLDKENYNELDNLTEMFIEVISQEYHQKRQFFAYPEELLKLYLIIIKSYLKRKKASYIEDFKHRFLTLYNQVKENNIPIDYEKYYKEFEDLMNS